MSETFGWLVLLFPLAGACRDRARLPGAARRVPAGSSARRAIAGSFVCAVGCAPRAPGPPARRSARSSRPPGTTPNTVGVDAQLSILVDPLSSSWRSSSAGVSTLIHLYSVAYMESDRGYARFFAYLNFFVFSMLLLVLAGTSFLLIVGWAFVGAASYLLISFWYRRTTATRAGIKAFVINVVGDVGLVLGTFFIFRGTGARSTSWGRSRRPTRPSPAQRRRPRRRLLLLLVGAFAKSAQVPLHTWLPDAMEGPTPVSALIHAATMVTAGVYLIARMHPLFEQAPAAPTSARSSAA